MKRLALAVLLLVGCTSARPTYVPRDPDLQRLPLYFYPSKGPARGALFFLGNDIGFWSPHQDLAERLSKDGFAVVGFDVKKFLDSFPDSALLRDSVLGHDLPPLVARAFHELGADSVPWILGGHSFGADIALRVEAMAPMPKVVGMLALGPTRRDHPIVDINTRLNIGQPTEPGSFDVAEQIRNTPPNVRIVLMRGASDKERGSDAAFQRSGGPRLTYTIIPFASHSLKSLVIAGPLIARALESLLPRK